MSTKGRRASWLVLLLAWPLAAAHAVCPDNACDCAGEAAQFQIVSAEKVVMQRARSFPGDEGVFGPRAGDTCTPKIRMTGLPVSDYSSSHILGDLILLAGPGRTAGRFRTIGGSVGGAIVDGDLATGGGQLRGDVEVGGAVDTSGTHPRLASCQQAISDMQSASAALAAVTPTLDLGKVVLRGEELTVNVPPGGPFKVITATSISLLSRRDADGNVVPSSLYVGGDPYRVVINTGYLRVGEEGFLDGISMINLPGSGRAVSLGKNVATPVILAPGRRIVAKVSGENQISNLYGRRITLRGPNAEGFNLPDACAP